MHRADAALALGTDYRLTPELAADGIDEWLERVAIEASGESSPLDAGTTLHLHATDDGLGAAGEWTITGGGDGIAWSHDHGKGDAALRGRDRICCWPSCAARRRPTAVSRCSATPPSGTGGWTRTPF